MTDLESLEARIRDANFEYAGRLALASRIGESRDSFALSKAILLAADQSLPREVRRELGRSVARIAFDLDEVKEVYDNEVRSFDEHAYDGFDAEVGILQWNARQVP